MRSLRHAFGLRRGVLLALALLACHGSGPSHAPTSTGKRYTVRAEVVTVPSQQGGDLVLRHEAIPDFTDRSGSVVGMAPMVMPFPVKSGVSLTGVEPGDKIQFVFSVDWDRGRYTVESLEKLPADTSLNLANRPATDGTSHGSESARE